ncbi:MAG: hypothetical protein D8M26_03870 [Ignavibacteriae bacterium]|nr:hypothetical protein [Ignavibacteriota bacterium]MCE7856428.1 hypothetical protein [Ignavibacteria bacterium CHB3]
MCENSEKPLKRLQLVFFCIFPQLKLWVNNIHTDSMALPLICATKQNQCETHLRGESHVIKLFH